MSEQEKASEEIMPLIDGSVTLRTSLPLGPINSEQFWRQLRRDLPEYQIKILESAPAKDDVFDIARKAFRASHWRRRGW